MENNSEGRITKSLFNKLVDNDLQELLTPVEDINVFMPEDKYKLAVNEDEQGKFILGQKSTLVLPDAGKKLKSASRPRKRASIPPKEPLELKSMIFEATIMEIENDEWIDGGIFSYMNEFMTIDIPDSPFKLKFRVEKLKEFLYQTIAAGNTGYITIENGRDKFKVPIEINPQLLLDNEDATII